MIAVDVARLTLRALLGRRRTLLMLFLAAVPILVGVLVRANDDGIRNLGTAVDGLVIRMVLPLIALVFGTAALGAELEDGTAVHLLTKPIPRLTIVVAKVAVAGALTALLVVPSAVISAVLMAEAGAGLANIARSIGAGVLAGAFMYAALFAALGVVTSRGLIIGLGYALIWEGLLAGLLPGTQVLSVREYIRGIVHAVSPSVMPSVVGDAALLYAVVALVGAVVIATWRLSAYEVRGTSD